MGARLSLMLASMLLTYPLFLIAQTDSRGQQQVVHVQDGGTSGRMESIFVPPITGAPFNLILVTEWTRALGSGGSFTLTNQRRIVRDGKGRIYQERWLLVPKGGKMQSQMDVIQITDPKDHTLYNCWVQQKVCDLLQYSGSTERAYRPMITPSGALSNGNGYHEHEDLGLSNTNGLDTTGYREINTINAGVFGNDQPMVTTREFWYSAQLGINLISKVDDPQSGKQIFTVKDLTTSEPDPKFFELPEGYKITDRTKE